MNYEIDPALEILRKSKLILVKFPIHYGMELSEPRFSNGSWTLFKALDV